MLGFPQSPHSQGGFGSSVCAALGSGSIFKRARNSQPQPMPTFLAIDPGTSNLGWVLQDDGGILDAGVDSIWQSQKPVHLTLSRATIQWYRARRALFEQADRVLIEQQYYTKAFMGVFPPLIVMEVLFALCEFEFPGKAVLLSSAAVKGHFEIKGTYDQRKKQVVEKAGLQHLQGRVHDIADCVLLCQYFADQQLLHAEKKAHQDAKADLRRRLRAVAEAGILEHGTPRDEDVRLGGGETEGNGVCDGCHARTTTIGGKRKRGPKLCRNCYQKSYRLRQGKGKRGTN